MVTKTEIHFLPVDESDTCTLSRDTMHLRLDDQICFYRQLSSDAVKPRGCISLPAGSLTGINKDANLILTPDLAYPVSYASLGHLLMAQHYCLCLSVSFSLPTASHLPLPTPSRPPNPYKFNP